MKENSMKQMPDMEGKGARIQAKNRIKSGISW